MVVAVCKNFGRMHSRSLSAHARHRMRRTLPGVCLCVRVRVSESCAFSVQNYDARVSFLLGNTGAVACAKAIGARARARTSVPFRFGKRRMRVGVTARAIIAHIGAFVLEQRRWYGESRAHTCSLSRRHDRECMRVYVGLFLCTRRLAIFAYHACKRKEERKE